MTPGQAYIAAISRRRADLQARTAFVAMAKTLCKPGACIFDFGAGPGLDAKQYALMGFRVLTYDVDPEMCQCLLAHCGEEIARRQIVPCDHLNRPDGATSAGSELTPAVGLITANFAPFNLLEEPAAEFRKLHGLLAADGKLLISILNPYFVGDLKYGWWWRNALRLLRCGEYAVAGGNGPIFRRSPARFRHLGEPYFSLRRVMRGLPGDAYRHGFLRWPALASSQYLFLVFDRCI